MFKSRNPAEPRQTPSRLAAEAGRWIRETPQGAVFTRDRLHRYTLWRRFQPQAEIGRMIAFIGLNPSTADETQNDPTVRRCIGFAQDWGYDGMVMLNIFAYRATDPTVMKAIENPIGRRNTRAIRCTAHAVDRVICCWGVHGAHRNRGPAIRNLLLKDGISHVFHLGLTQSGHPKHPLYLRSDTTPVRWD